MRTVIAALVVFGLLAPAAHARALDAPVAHAAATCADYANQAEAQRAADTRDGDGDGIYCESLPCPCLKPGNDGGSAPAPTPTPAPSTPSCSKPSGVQPIGFSGTKYPTIRPTRWRRSARAGRRCWCSTAPAPTRGARGCWRARRRGTATTATSNPPALGRGRGAGLVGGSDPRGWKADVDYVPSSENRSHGSVMGTKLRRFCNGTKFRHAFY